VVGDSAVTTVLPQIKTLLFAEDVYNMLDYAEDKDSHPRLLTYDNR